MTELIDAVIKLASEQLDLLLIVAIVVLVQGLKKTLPKVPKKLWMLANVALGFLAAWLIVPASDLRAFVRQGLIYAAGAELAYQGWRTITETVKTRWKR
jgi:hypothetical protein